MAEVKGRCSDDITKCWARVGREQSRVVEERVERWPSWAWRGSTRVAKFEGPWSMRTRWRTRQSKMAIRVDLENGGGNGLNHQVSMSAQHMNAIVVKMVLADEHWGKMYPEFMGEVEG